jgi:hypothetical protein
MERPRVERGRPEADPLRRLRDQQQRRDRGLEQQVVEDREDVDPGGLRAARDLDVAVRPLV